jgi:hypothetical protein
MHASPCYGFARLYTFFWDSALLHFPFVSSFNKIMITELANVLCFGTNVIGLRNSTVTTHELEHDDRRHAVAHNAHCTLHHLGWLFTDTLPNVLTT